jgi:formyltetrahydrofolate deformylase
MPNHILKLSCDDRIGIVGAVSGFLAERRCNIVDSQQFGDAETGRFFMRVHFLAEDPTTTLESLQGEFGPVGERFGMDWQIHDRTRRTRTILMVSKFGHCLNDLLFRWSTGALHCDLAAIVSNHPDFEPLAKAYDIPFHHVPVSRETKPAAEAELLSLVSQYDAELVVLARYMQVLSDDLCRALSGRAINIHHSFLPSFKGAKPYHQAYERGVKLIGATAHYVTADLDEGPIIEQEIARVDHTFGPDRLVAAGRDVEALALSRAVQAHAEHRVLLNGSKTVVFR